MEDFTDELGSAGRVDLVRRCQMFTCNITEHQLGEEKKHDINPQFSSNVFKERRLF